MRAKTPTPTPSFSVNVYHVDTCLPDYWAGTTRPYMQIPVGKRTTYKEMREMLFEEVRQGQVQGTGTVARLLSDDFVGPENDYVAALLTRRLYAAIKEDVAPEGRATRYPFFHRLPDNAEDVYAFFIIEVTGHVPATFHN